MNSSPDRVGTKTNRLTIVSRDSVSPSGNVRWLCKCDCGNAVVRSWTNIKLGSTKSCGCIRKEGLIRHGDNKRGAITAEYRLWQKIKARCYNENVWNYSTYGGRGIRMYDPWRNDYPLFLSYIVDTIGRKPSKLYSIDRINNDGNYEPGNLRWATAKEQVHNQRHGNKYVRNYSA